jgi:hypothetical protein
MIRFRRLDMMTSFAATWNKSVPLHRNDVPGHGYGTAQLLFPGALLGATTVFGRAIDEIILTTTG